jgi:hypothetical protein
MSTISDNLTEMRPDEHSTTQSQDETQSLWHARNSPEETIRRMEAFPERAAKFMELIPCPQRSGHALRSSFLWDRTPVFNEPVTDGWLKRLAFASGGFYYYDSVHRSLRISDGNETLFATRFAFYSATLTLSRAT